MAGPTMQRVSTLVSKDISNYLTNKVTWGIYYNAKSYDLVGDGTTDDYAALSTLINTTINGANATIIFSSGTYKLSTSITIPSNVTIILAKGAMLSPDSTKTVTINGAVEAGLWQIFTGSGSVVGTNYDSVFPQWFGAVGDGVTSDSSAFTKGFAFFSTRGGSLDVGSGRYLFDTTVTIPVGCGLKGYNESWNGTWETTGDNYIDDVLGSVIIINTAATINLSSSSTILSCVIIRKGLVMPATSNVLFAGTAITSTNTSLDAAAGGQVRNCLILGFNKAIDCAYHNRITVQNVGGDNNYGILLDFAFDVVRIENIHFWPFITNTATAPLTAHHRPGQGLYLSGTIDIGQFTNIFTYGYNIGIQLDGNVGSGNFINCHTDGTAQFVGSKGFEIAGNAFGSVFVGCSSYSNSYGYYINCATTDDIVFTNCRAVNNTSTGWEIVQGTAMIIGCNVDLSTDGVIVSGASSLASVVNTVFGNIATSYINANTGGKVIYETGNKYDGTGNIATGSITQVASFDPFDIPKTGNFFEVTGTTGFGTITGGWTGRDVTLKFVDVLTVFDGAVANIAGNFVTTANDVLKIIHDGTQWLEVSRSVN